MAVVPNPTASKVGRINMASEFLPINMAKCAIILVGSLNLSKLWIKRGSSLLGAIIMAWKLTFR